MKKLCFLVLFSWTLFSSAQDSLNTRITNYYISIRPVRGEMRGGVSFKVSSKMAIGPEVGYQLHMGTNDTYYDDNGILSDKAYINAYIMRQTYWFGIALRKYLNSNHKGFFSFSPFYLYGNNKKGNYVFVNRNYGSWPTKRYSGGSLYFNYIGMEVLRGGEIMKTQTVSIEYVLGASIFYKRCKFNI